MRALPRCYLCGSRDYCQSRSGAQLDEPPEQCPRWHVEGGLVVRRPPHKRPRLNWSKARLIAEAARRYDRETKRRKRAAAASAALAARVSAPVECFECLLARSRARAECRDPVGWHIIRPAVLEAAIVETDAGRAWRQEQVDDSPPLDTPNTRARDWLRGSPPQIGPLEPEPLWARAGGGWRRPWGKGG